jgi:cytochrome oxidase Cu insertion factor (SCO1/SenC/PrrC family)
MNETDRVAGEHGAGEHGAAEHVDSPEPAGEGGGPGAQPPRPRPWASGRTPRMRLRRSTVLLTVGALLAGVAFATVFAFAVTRLNGKNQPPRPSGIPASVSTSLASLMQLSPVPHVTAPGFTLTDQSGRPVSMASFRGRTVVLTFMDSHCTDICPIVSREFIDARNDLGSAASRVVFIAVNVNPYHRRVSDVASFSRAQRLESIGSWHFVTGSLKSLRAVWKNYEIFVQAPSRNADVIHTSLIYFIAPNGQERYVTSPMVDHTKEHVPFLPAGQLADWGRGIALVARAITP